jgi:arsenite methyltransferase
MADQVTQPDSASDAACCSTEQQATCCEPAMKAECCAPAHAEGTCGCSGGVDELAPADVRELVREHYAASARAVTESATAASCCSTDVAMITDEQAESLGANLYGDDERAELPDTAVLASLGCGNPIAVAELHQGETVLDLGSGGGIDVLLSARRVGPTGMAFGLDMTDEMLELARTNQAKAGVENVRWLKGHIEEIPLPDASVDVVISNCVISLSVDKRRVLTEAARVLRPGGRFAITDIVADHDMDADTRANVSHFVGCVAGALTDDDFQAALGDAGLVDVEIRETHRVHEHAGSAIVRARKPPVTTR